MLSANDTSSGLPWDTIDLLIRREEPEVRENDARMQEDDAKDENARGLGRREESEQTTRRTTRRTTRGTTMRDNVAIMREVLNSNRENDGSARTMETEKFYVLKLSVRYLRESTQR